MNVSSKRGSGTLLRVCLYGHRRKSIAAIATCVRCGNEFELVAEWHHAISEDGDRLTLVYRSAVCDDCLTQSELEQRLKWETGEPVDPVLMGVDPRPERRVTAGWGETSP